jgi:hypothetical protein
MVLIRRPKGDIRVAVVLVVSMLVYMFEARLGAIQINDDTTAGIRRCGLVSDELPFDIVHRETGLESMEEAEA